LEFHAAAVVNGAGDPVGTVDAVELVTVGQRKGMGHGTDGARRYVVAVDVPSRRVTVGSAAEAVTTAIALPGSTLTWVDRPLGDGARAVAQVSAHGRPAPCSIARTDDGLMVEFDVPQRPVAAGQTVALYDIVDQDAVVGAGIAA
jgi:tRNA-specific 2-thiouridylase